VDRAKQARWIGRVAIATAVFACTASGMPEQAAQLDAARELEDSIIENLCKANGVDKSLVPRL
jgi:hypothetical protein